MPQGSMKYFTYHVDHTYEDNEVGCISYDPNIWIVSRSHDTITITQHDKIVWQMTDHHQSNDFAINQAIMATITDYVGANA